MTIPTLFIFIIEFIFCLQLEEMVVPAEIYPFFQLGFHFIRLYGIQCIASDKGLESLILLEQPTNSSAWEELTNSTFRLIIDISFTVETNEYGLQSMYRENCSTTVDVILEIYFIPTAESNAMDYNLPILFGVLVVFILIGTRMRSK